MRDDTVGGIAGAYVVGSTSLANAAWTTFVLAGVVFDDLIYQNPPGGSRLTVPTGAEGIYLALGLTSADLAGAGYVGARLLRNGSVTATCEQKGSGFYNGVAAWTWDLAQLAAGDFYEVQGWQNQGVDRAFGGRLMVALLDTAGTCYAQFAGASSIASSTWTAIGLTEEVDTAGMHSDATNPSRITAQQAGNYLVMAAGAFAPNASGSRRVRITKNGAAISGSEAAILASAVVNENTVNTYALVSLAAGDYIEVEHWQNSGAGLNLVSSRLAVVLQEALEVGFANGVGTLAVGGASITPLPLASEDVDPQGWHSDTVNPSQFVAQNDGAYLMLIKCWSAAPQHVVGTFLFRNGSLLGADNYCAGNDVESVTGVSWVGVGDTLVGQTYVPHGAEGDAGDTLNLVECSFGWIRLRTLEGIGP